jgi:hypothetical protein
VVVSRQRFLELLRAYPDASIVSFVGTPISQPEDFGKLPQPMPPVLAVVTYGVQTRDLLQRGIIQVAIVPRFTTPQNPDREPTMRREWFDKFYTVVTKTNASELPQ